MAITLLLIEGLSGLLVAITLLSAGFATNGAAPGVAIAGGMLVYGLVLAVAAIGIIFGRAWARILAAAALLAGVAFLAGIALVVGSDLVILSGVVIWGVTLACLYAGRSTAP